ncbi:bifunctional proline dehydrogenase/L-glutamate gamma-semialdehyde dehydrogenase PutA [Aquisalinus flavus]|uniref:Bifunctional protein PutA n=1 Tax=Aquisalinus flavus TaxID=1526572 RepID=A0A8J2Y7F8_9PROT|nr:bifunctional proline dehydrogenase/L-glutamate gamma-semialdehyde dehydrogenase PutA [Aquisalinus flavus]MBD0425680.1 bifunctional proline dehydrogenase/L-glutamate gamma-semialdehyde dehydrogenase PutA [Aquisalinus flavus]UNE48708.1 bifunctional proline dehydrogenase/L-glutamate gamma-semialdehyde dehydrogenase PutA [Aquisalinus flavus]GGD14109.1 bifunctional proline dehydrogenase/L-glutamate gamma-semialdehyde dehydrogenase [Aquisalinus flavus]
MARDSAYPPFEADYAPDDRELILKMLDENRHDPDMAKRIRDRATRFIDGMKNTKHTTGLEEFMQEYSLSTKEGLALMVLAEALLRVPDAKTQDRLIEEKLSAGDWDDEDEEEDDHDDSWLLMAASWGIGMSANIVRPREKPGAVLHGMVKRLGVPVIRQGTRQAMHYLGRHFVLGQTIKEALKRAEKQRREGFWFSFDMLGEGARTQKDAERYLESYSNALDAIGEQSKSFDSELPSRPGLSVKLSALHPRYEARNRDEVMRDLVPKVIELAKRAKEYQLNLTIDAEEADRLELSLDVFRAVAEDPGFDDWMGLGLAVQAYQKRAPEVVDWVAGLAKALDRKFMVRLVKGAYWDTEIKRAQERGLEDFPVFTRKAATDLCYLDCARRLLDARPHIFPQFATHNAVTLAAIFEIAGDKKGYEFQRLHGMGESLYDLEIKLEGVPARIYAPVGGYKDLLAYLVRRMLENTANSSFVSQIADPHITREALLVSPQEHVAATIAGAGDGRHPLIRRPLNLYSDRQNSAGMEFGHKPVLDHVAKVTADFTPPSQPIAAIINGRQERGDDKTAPLVNPTTGEEFGSMLISSPETVDKAVKAARAAFQTWGRTEAEDRALYLNRYADILEQNMDRFFSLCAVEAGKTIDDAVAEVREAADFCRYYALQAEKQMGGRIELEGPTGQRDGWQLEPRGIFACISPWNFPLAIFVGQVTAALAAGNTVVAKPAEQTPYIAHVAVELMKQAGFPDGVCNLVLGEGETGKALVEHEDINGVCFTGSTATARAINRALAAKDGPIIPLIAETGGINALVVDSTALPEQVADDVVTSAFQSSGQRCSALRILYLQDDVADGMLEMIIGAAEARRFGDPADPKTDIGPVIDQEALDNLQAHAEKMEKQGRLVWKGKTPAGLNGTFMAPHIFELDALDGLKTEAFGPILHVVRWKNDQLDKVLDAVNATGYGLTFGIHSRIDGIADYVLPRVKAGNIYVNRNIIGAIVGVQPFGGAGLSGTGPKAGGPNYLQRFCEEKAVSVNTAAAGGNASLIALAN